MEIKAKKQQMTQVFLESGRLIPVTVVKTDAEVAEDLVSKAAVVVGVSKGKGFTGVMKKWNFKGEMATRGQSTTQRKPGSIGSQTPGRVLPGKKMAGRHGGIKVTIKNVSIVGVNSEKKELLLSGPVPGARNSEVRIKVLG